MGNIIGTSMGNGSLNTKKVSDYFRKILDYSFIMVFSFFIEIQPICD